MNEINSHKQVKREIKAKSGFACSNKCIIYWFFIYSIIFFFSSYRSKYSYCRTECI